MFRMAALCAPLLLLGACATESTAAETPGTFSISGTLTVKQAPQVVYSTDYADDPTAGDVCLTRRGFTDIRAGAQVVVTDESGNTIGVGHLPQGQLKSSDLEVVAGGFVARACSFDIRVSGVPTGHDFYSLEVSSRGELTYSASRIREYLDITLG